MNNTLRLSRSAFFVGSPTLSRSANFVGDSTKAFKTSGASPASFYCLSLTCSMKPVKVISHPCCAAVYDACRPLGMTRERRLSFISSVWAVEIAGSSVSRCLSLILSASARTCRQRSLHVDLTPSIVRRADGKVMLPYSAILGKIKFHSWPRSD